MWFKSKKRVDPKLRFEQVAFKRELTRARSFKREVRNKDKSFPWLTWKLAGLFFLLLTVLGLIYYVVFVPNFLFVTHIGITGTEVDAGGVQATVNKFLEKKAGFIFPRRNMLFLSTTKLHEYILDNNLAVYEVTNISKGWTAGGIEIAVVARRNEYLLEVQGEQFIVSNDGKTVGRSVPGAQMGGLLHVFSGVQPVVGEKYFDADKLQSLSVIRVDFTNITGLTTSSVEFGDARGGVPEQGILLSSQEFIVHIVPNSSSRLGSFRIFFDTRLDTSATLENLRLLLDNTTVERLQNLSYIDMRFREKSFICLRGASCEKAPEPPPPPSPSESPPPPVESLENN